MDSSVSPKDEIWFLRVCHHISTGLYKNDHQHRPPVFFYSYTNHRYQSVGIYIVILKIRNWGWREINQQDATNTIFIIKLLSQHVSAIIIPIIRRTRPCVTAYGLVLLMMGIMMPVTCWYRRLIINIGLVASCWFISLHSTHSLRPSCTQPQPAQPVQNIICSNTRSCSLDDGHNDARNMLR